ncbi:MAG: hypothetical protein M3Y50_05725 [Acidobacteriota bacterium]|nr:hypothetical protein [Acidobacteriota bacterium]
MAYDPIDERTRQPPQTKTPYLGENALRGVPIRCQYCSGQSFRRSTLRGEDFPQLLLMRYPVRCLRCSQRQGVSFTVAGVSISSKVRPSRAKRGTPVTGAWSEPESDVSRNTESRQNTLP